MFRTAAFMIFRRRHITPLFLLTALTVTTLFSQSVVSRPTEVVDHLFFSRTGAAEWASGGVRTAEAGSMSAPFNNPALLRAPSLTMYAEFGKRSETPYILGITVDGQYLLPSFGQISASFGGLHWALAYTNAYDRYRDLGEINITAVQQPEGMGENVKYTDRIRTHSVLVSASFVQDHDLSVGLSFGLNIVTLRGENFYFKENGQGTGLFVNAGVYIQPSSSLHVGGTIRFSEDILFSSNIESERLLIDPALHGNNTVINATFTGTPYSARFPITAQAGCLWDVMESVSLMAEVEMEGWSELSVTYESTVDVHVGVLLKPHPLLRLRGGYFTESSPQKSATALRIDQGFMTAGFEWTALSGVVITGSAVRSVWSAVQSSAFAPLTEGFYQHLYQLGLLYRLP